ncbi:MAG: (d)CMP kinase [Leptospirales bacterium]|jgi:cytidylate kinase
MSEVLKTGAPDGDGRYPVVALDGPAGSGKSTVARKLADRLGFIHADSGAIYRTLTLACMDKFGAGEDVAAFGRALEGARLDAAALKGLGCTVELDRDPAGDAVQSNRIAGRDVGEDIRTPEVTSRIRFIADNIACRELVNQLLRDFSSQTGLVADGRDIGTVVFPESPFKFFLDASVEVRAKRRFEDFQKQGKTVPLKDLEADIAARDEQDRNRPVGALRPAEDAILIDTSSLDVNAVLSRVLSHLQIQF